MDPAGLPAAHCRLERHRFRPRCRSGTGRCDPGLRPSAPATRWSAARPGRRRSRRSRRPSRARRASRCGRRRHHGAPERRAGTDRPAEQPGAAGVGVRQSGTDHPGQAGHPRSFTPGRSEPDSTGNRTPECLRTALRATAAHRPPRTTRTPRATAARAPRRTAPRTAPGRRATGRARVPRTRGARRPWDATPVVTGNGSARDGAHTRHRHPDGRPARAASAELSGLSAQRVPDRARPATPPVRAGGPVSASQRLPAAARPTTARPTTARPTAVPGAGIPPASAAATGAGSATAGPR